jgi:hypothetical protein
MIEKFLCHGVHAHGSIGDRLCSYVYSGTLTDALFAAVLLLVALCFLLAKLK